MLLEHPGKGQCQSLAVILRRGEGQAERAPPRYVEALEQQLQLHQLPPQRMRTYLTRLARRARLEMQRHDRAGAGDAKGHAEVHGDLAQLVRSEEHTSEFQSH